MMQCFRKSTTKAKAVVWISVSFWWKVQSPYMQLMLPQCKLCMFWWVTITCTDFSISMLWHFILYKIIFLCILALSDMESGSNMTGGDNLTGHNTIVSVPEMGDSGQSWLRLESPIYGLFTQCQTLLSFTKNYENSGLFHIWKCHVWSIVFCKWIYMYKNVTSGPSYFSDRSEFP